MPIFGAFLAVFLAFHILAPTLSSNDAVSPPAQGTTSTPERVAADTARVTPGGATFTVPSSCSINRFLAPGKSSRRNDRPE
jgi:hypothetical protein